jgi:hypothetical protein
MKRIINLVLTILLIIAISLILISQNMKSKYKKAVRHELERTKSLKPDLLTETDMEHLPEVVKKYIRYTGFVGKEKILNFRLECNGGIRFNPDEEYMPLRSVQYNFMDLYSRLFYIVAKKKGIPAIGLHLYQNAKAVFQIKILGLFTVVNAKGPKMDQGETVTVLNDMFFMAPGSLIDKRIQWEIIDSLSVKTIFTNDNISVSAVLYFNDEGKLINFTSNDRFDTDGKEYKNYPWETPVIEYRVFNSYRLPSKAKLIYKRPEGDFCYAEFELLSIEYNCKKFK